MLLVRAEVFRNNVSFYYLAHDRTSVIVTVLCDATDLCCHVLIIIIYRFVTTVLGLQI